MKITSIGHGTCLLEIGDQVFLTDPCFSERLLFFFPRRRKAGLSPMELPPLSAILVSHAHYDHLDVFSYKFFKTEVPIIVPEGLGGFVARFLPNPVVEIPAGGKHLHRGVEIHAQPVKHHGCRWMPWRWRAAAAFVLKSPQESVYFCGDSGYGEQFRKTGEKFSLDAALLPIGGSQPRWLTRHSKLSPDEALEAFRDLKAKKMVPIDWGVFDFFGEGIDTAEKRMAELIREKKLEDRVQILQPGKSWIPPFEKGGPGGI
ncbi:MAG TPA: MBL fold metallo-hydrolase [bacterium]|nr:MBL fold metallo-hydrolase [bacterium]